MTYETIRYEVTDGVATVTLNRPGKLNAFTTQMGGEISQALDTVDRDDAVRAVIVTGEGRAFCAGAEMSDGAASFHTASPDDRVDYGSDEARDGGGILALRLFRCLKPVVGAINGAAVGIGATMTLPMDIRIASDTARFGFVFTRLGIVPEAASSWFLPRLVGISRALDWSMSGRLFGADEAMASGLVRSIHAPDGLIETAREIAHSIIDATAPVSVALTRQMLWQGLGMSHPMEAHRIDSRGVLARGRSQDAVEGVSAFLEKRAAQFPDRVSRDMPDYYPWWREPDYA
jgi:enoyl-CoA hydratase/carnithine racemase